MLKHPRGSIGHVIPEASATIAAPTVLQETSTRIPDEKISLYFKCLERVDLLAALNPDELKTVAKAITEKQFSKGEFICQQGEPGTTFYILYEGEVSVLKDGVEQTKMIANPSRQTVQFFGEKLLVKSESCQESLQVISSTATAFALDCAAIKRIVGPLEKSGQETKFPVQPASGNGANDKPGLLTQLQKEVDSREQELRRAQAEDKTRMKLIVALEREVFEKEQQSVELRTSIKKLGDETRAELGSRAAEFLQANGELAVGGRDKLAEEIKARGVEAEALSKRLTSLEETIQQKRAEVVAKDESIRKMLIQLSSAPEPPKVA
mmetsp:Transcript_14102/g.25399  ORF Transcript_14102/g.25399 Transcript_14102/m.25399 type:complete len:323 (+) Transcript_14102:1-969(+)